MTVKKINGWLTPALFLAILGGLSGLAVFVFYPKSAGEAHAQEMEYRHKLQDQLNTRIDQELKTLNHRQELLHDNVLLLGERFRVKMIRDDPENE